MHDKVSTLCRHIAHLLPDRVRYWVIIRAVSECDTYNPNYQEMAATTHKRALAKARRKLEKENG